MVAFNNLEEEELELALMIANTTIMVAMDKNLTVRNIARTLLALAQECTNEMDGGIADDEEI